MKKINLIFILMLIMIFSNISLANELTPIYFYDKNCSDCKIINKYIEENNIKITKYDIYEKNNKDLLKKYNLKYNMDKKISNIIPIIFYKDDFYIGKESILKILEGDSSKQKINYNLFFILSLGLLDGINPCAITTLMVLFSMLFYSNNKKMLITGICFILGVFIGNFGIGIGLLTILTTIKNTLFYRMIYIFMILILLILIYLNISDISKKENKTKLSIFIFGKILKIIKYISNHKYIYIVSFICGILVIILEFSCTGQIYLPTILYMEKNMDYNLNFLMFLYNIMFIIPLIIVLFISYKLKTSDFITNKIQDNLYKLKFISIIFYVILLILFLKELF